MNKILILFLLLICFGCDSLNKDLIGTWTLDDERSVAWYTNNPDESVFGHSFRDTFDEIIITDSLLKQYKNGILVNTFSITAKREIVKFKSINGTSFGEMHFVFEDPSHIFYKLDGKLRVYFTKKGVKPLGANGTLGAK